MRHRKSAYLCEVKARCARGGYSLITRSVICDPHPTGRVVLHKIDATRFSPIFPAEDLDLC